MAGSTRKTRPRALRLKSCIRVLWIAACITAVVTPRLSAEITLINRLSEARTYPHVNFLPPSTPPEALLLQTLSLADRVAYQYVIEEVYWRHRIWPKENGRPKPSLDAVMSAAQIQQEVEKVLRDSDLLWDHGQPITSEQLQAEMDRIARDTKQPDVLRKLFAALNNDPILVAECLARPFLSEHLLRDLSMQGTCFHRERDADHRTFEGSRHPVRWTPPNWNSRPWSTVFPVMALAAQPIAGQNTRFKSESRRDPRSLHASTAWQCAALDALADDEPSLCGRAKRHRQLCQFGLENKARRSCFGRNRHVHEGLA